MTPAQPAGFVRLRPSTPDDEPFLFSAFCAARCGDFIAAGCTGDHLDLILRMQFRVQQQAYQSRYPESAPDIILATDQQVGTWWVAETADEHRIVDIAILPEFRGKGIGSALVIRLIEKARQTGKPVRSSIAKSNGRSVSFHAHLGFQICGDDGVYIQMQMA